MGAIARLLEEDHDRLDELLARSVADPEHFDLESFGQFRSGLLRHIGIEEKLLMPLLREQGGEHAAMALTLREGHSALASLLVGPPDHALVKEILSILEDHNPLEEGEDGMYAIAERLLGDRLEETLEKVKNYPEVPAMPYRMSARVQRTAEGALALARSKRTG